MNRRLAAVITICLSLSFLIIFSASLAPAQQRDRRVDDPEDQEDLNRELWRFAKKSSYKSILRYVAAAQRISRKSTNAEVELPNGWRIAPAGTQVEVGHLPYEAVLFGGRLVVLNNGYYYHEPSEVSIVDLQSG